jgi:hypothetical protein
MVGRMACRNMNLTCGASISALVDEGGAFRRGSDGTTDCSVEVVMGE